MKKIMSFAVALLMVLGISTLGASPAHAYITTQEAQCISDLGWMPNGALCFARNSSGGITAWMKTSGGAIVVDSSVSVSPVGAFQTNWRQVSSRTVYDNGTIAYLPDYSTVIWSGTSIGAGQRGYYNVSQSIVPAVGNYAGQHL